MICANCGKTFAPTTVRHKGCCSVKCYYAHYYRTIIRPKRAAEKQPHEPKLCPICGKSFTPRRVHQLYCSSACRKKNYQLRQKAAKQSLCQPKICPACGVEFTPTNNRQKYCSPLCRRQAAEAARLRIRIEAVPVKTYHIEQLSPTAPLSKQKPRVVVEPVQLEPLKPKYKPNQAELLDWIFADKAGKAEMERDWVQREAAQ